MKIFIINLDKDAERLEWSKEQAEKQGYEFERMPGVLGSSITKDELRKVVKKWRFLLNMGRSPLIGEIGCALAHINIYRRMVEDDIPIACILEDDIFTLDGFKEHLEVLDSWLDPQRPQILRLNFGPQHSNIPKNVKLDTPGIRVSDKRAAACSYCITLSGAKTLLKENYPITTVTDSWYRWEKLGLIELYNSNPKVCYHNSAESGLSSVIGRESGYKNIDNTICDCVARKILKGIGFIIDRIY